MDPKLDLAIREVVIANRILAHENVTDASGHVSARHPLHPDRFLISWSRSPEIVTREDIMEVGLDGAPLNGDTRPPYQERFIHAAIYASRPDVNAVVHAHPEEVLPFSVTGEPLRALISSASMVGTGVPTWDIADHFGDHTSLLVESLEQGRDLAEFLGERNMVLMAAHGIAAACPTMIEVVRLSVYAARNARVQLAAMHFGVKRTVAPPGATSAPERRPEADLLPVALRAPEFRRNDGRQEHFNLTGDLKFAVKPAIRHGVRDELAPVEREDVFVLF